MGCARSAPDEGQLRRALAGRLDERLPAMVAARLAAALVVGPLEAAYRPGGAL